MPEVRLLVVAAPIAGCDDSDEIADWGEAPLDVLNGLSEYDFGTPGEDGLRVLMNRIDPALFQECCSAWVTEMWRQAAALIALEIALDGTTSRRSHDRGRGQKALPLVSAFATTPRLVLAPEAGDETENEGGAIPALLERLDLEDALVTIEAIACTPNSAAASPDRKGHDLLAVQATQPTLHREIALYVADPPPGQTASVTDVDKGHGRIETRRDTVSHSVDGLLSDRR